jgi:hypothetical protein
VKLRHEHGHLIRRPFKAGIAIIDSKGKDELQALTGLFETHLSQGDGNDRVTEAVIILFGRLAQHLDPTDPRVATVIQRLMDALRTPSEVVQQAVSECLPPLGTQ